MKFENTKVFNFEGAIRGMRNPLDSWSKSDSDWSINKIGTAANSCSTMHKIGAYPFVADMFDHDDDDSQYINSLLPVLNMLRDQYNNTKANKDLITLKRMLPESFIQKRTVTLNYAVIRSMIHQRKHHRLYHWSNDFINWCHTLPYAEELLFFNN